MGSIILQLGLNSQLNSTQWFIMIGHIRQTRYFHVNFQTGQLILIRPIEELINQTNLIELRINVTNDWINMNTIKVYRTKTILEIIFYEFFIFRFLFVLLIIEYQQ